MHDSYVLPKK